jgi:hypothetical protein
MPKFTHILQKKRKGEVDDETRGESGEALLVSGLVQR